MNGTAIESSRTASPPSSVPSGNGGSEITRSAGSNGSGTDKVLGWDDGTLDSITQQLRDDMNRLRIAQRVFPVVDATAELNIADDGVNPWNPGPLAMPERPNLHFVELSVQFTMTKAQVDNEATDHTGLKLARLAATRLAQAEDRLLFLGQAALPGLPPLGATVTTPRFVQTGLLFENLRIPIFVDPNAGAGIYPESIFGGVTRAIAELYGDGQSEPFGCVLHFTNFADAYRPTAQSLVIPADRILGVIREDDQTQKGGFHPSEALVIGAAAIDQQVNDRVAEAEDEEFEPSPEFSRYLDDRGYGGLDPINCGLVAALAADPTKIYMGKLPTAELTQQTAQGVYNFRVTERFQYRSHDPRSLIRIEFRPAPISIPTAALLSRPATAPDSAPVSVTTTAPVSVTTTARVSVTSRRRARTR